MSKVNVRALIADSLVEMEREGTYLSAMEQAVLDKYDYIDVRDKAFYKRVMDGVTELRVLIDYVTDSFSSRPVSKLKPYIRAIMRMSVYQLMYMDSVPDSAVCNEAVKLTAARGFAGLKGYVNGVLRNISRNKNNISYPSKDDDVIKYLSVIYSCPEWIVNMFTDSYGADRTERILAAFLEEAPLSVRLRGCGADKDTDSEARVGVTDAATRVSEGILLGNSDTDVTLAGKHIRPNPHLPYGLLLERAGSVSELAGYSEGYFVVQDTGSMLVSELAGVREGDTVIDLCAAPGGKSIHIADITTSKLSDFPTPIHSFDISEERCARMRENISRLKLDDMITVETRDATVFMPEYEYAADIVIADVPCSGLGVMGHKSDIKYRVTPDDIESLASLQRSIIDCAVRYVCGGGRLIYSTCTVSRKENEAQAEYIIDKYGFTDITDKALASSAATPPEGYKTDAPLYGTQLLPDIWTSDGFYICVLEAPA